MKKYNYIIKYIHDGETKSVTIASDERLRIDEIINEFFDMMNEHYSIENVEAMWIEGVRVKNK